MVFVVSGDLNAPVELPSSLFDAFSSMELSCFLGLVVLLLGSVSFFGFDLGYGKIKMLGYRIVLLQFDFASCF